MRLDTDPYLERYAARVRGMNASAIRALFALTARPEIISFAGGNPAVEALDADAVEEVVRRVVRESASTALQYGIGQGRPELREQLALVMEHEGIAAHVDDLIVTVGGQQALELVAGCFIDPGDVVIAEGPTYVGGVAALSSYQADVRHVALDDEGMRVDELEDLLEQLTREGRRAKYVYTIPNHQNPGGVSLSVERRHRLAELAESHDLMILEDNPYGLIDFEGRTFPALRSLVPDRVIYVGTVSKTFSPGVRTGWIAAPPPVRDKLVLLREAADLCPSPMTQMIVETWFQTQPWREQIKTFREVYREKADAMLGALDEEMPAEVSWTRPTGAFYVWMTVPGGIDTTDLLAKAIAHRVAYVPGRGFYADGDGGDKLRLCFSQPSVERIREGIARFGEVLTDEIELVRAFYGDAPPDPGRGGERPGTASAVPSRPDLPASGAEEPR